MHNYSSSGSLLLTLLGLTFTQGFSFIKVAVALVVLGVVYQLVKHRRLFTQTKSGYLVWWGGMMLLSWAVLVYFAIEARWLWRFLFG